MKVKVSYTVDFEEIPKVIRGITEESQDLQAEMAELSSRLHVGDLGVNSVRDLSRMKDIAATLMEKFSDCESILVGFLQAALTTPQDASEESSDADT